MRNNVKEEYKRILYKELKRRKLFSKFCMAIAQAYAPSYSYYDTDGNKIYQNKPKEKKEEYILLFTNNDNEFFDGVKKWHINPNPMIQP